MSEREIARYLVSPEPPMPSYSVMRRKEPRNFDEMVRFLASLE